MTNMNLHMISIISSQLESGEQRGRVFGFPCEPMEYSGDMKG